jgi:hypothetical protein
MLQLEIKVPPYDGPTGLIEVRYILSSNYSFYLLHGVNDGFHYFRALSDILQHDITGHYKIR